MSLREMGDSLPKKTVSKKRVSKKVAGNDATKVADFDLSDKVITKPIKKRVVKSKAEAILEDTLLSKARREPSKKDASLSVGPHVLHEQDYDIPSAGAALVRHINHDEPSSTHDAREETLIRPGRAKSRYNPLSKPHSVHNHLLSGELALRSLIEETKHVYVEHPVSRNHTYMAVACLTMLISVGVYLSPKTHAESFVFYPETCLGGWVNPNFASGVQQVESNEFPKAFNQDNSAVLPLGVNSEMYCGGFSGSFDKETKPKKIIVALSWSSLGEVSATTTVVDSSFASSSLILLDGDASSTVDFVLATSTETSSTTEVVNSPLLLIGDNAVQFSSGDNSSTTTDIATTTSSDGSSENMASTTEQSPQTEGGANTELPPTDVLPVPASTSEVASSTAAIPPQESGVSEQVATPVSVVEPQLLPAAPSVDPVSVVAPVPEVSVPESVSAPVTVDTPTPPVSESPISLFGLLRKTIAFSFGMSAYADETSPSEGVPQTPTPEPAPVAPPQESAPAEVPTPSPAPSAQAPNDTQSVTESSSVGGQTGDLPTTVTTDTGVTTPQVESDTVSVDQSLVATPTSESAGQSELVTSSSSLLVVDTASSSLSGTGGLDASSTPSLVEQLASFITNTIELPSISSVNKPASVTPVSVAAIPTVGTTTKTKIDLGLASSSSVFRSESVFVNDEDLSVVMFSSSTEDGSHEYVTADTSADDDSQTNFLEVLYTFDGINWTRLGKVNEESMVYRTFEIPVTATTSWADMSTLQIKIVPVTRVDPTPAVHLDAIKVEVLYESNEPREHPDFTRDSVLKDKSDDNVRVINIINSDTNNREIWYTTLYSQAEFGISPGSWVRLDMGDEVKSYRLVEIYGRYLFWIDEATKMFWTTNLEKGSNEGTVLFLDATTTIPFVKPNGESWVFEYNYQKRKGVIYIRDK